MNRPKTKDCPVCGRGHLRGKRAYVPTRDGRLIRKLVCQRCADKAERIIVKVTADLCMTPGCPHNARVCTHCAASMVLHERQNAISDVVGQIRAVIAASRMMKNDDQGVVQWNEGRLEGLRSALAMLLRDNEKRSKVDT